jgi:hypothetical protein
LLLGTLQRGERAARRKAGQHEAADVTPRVGHQTSISMETRPGGSVEGRPDPASSIAEARAIMR